MPTVDIIILTVIGLSFIFGAWRGLVKEVLALLFWIAAIILAGMYADQAAGYLDGVTQNYALQRVIGFACIFVVTVFLGGFITSFISKLTNAAGLKLTDRVLGALFGIARGVVIVSLVIMLSEPFESVSSHFTDSRTVPYLQKVADQMQSLLDRLPMDLPALSPDSVPA